MNSQEHGNALYVWSLVHSPSCTVNFPFGCSKHWNGARNEEKTGMKQMERMVPTLATELCRSGLLLSIATLFLLSCLYLSLPGSFLNLSVTQASTLRCRPGRIKAWHVKCCGFNLGSGKHCSISLVSCETVASSLCEMVAFIFFKLLHNSLI